MPSESFVGSPPIRGANSLMSVAPLRAVIYARYSTDLQRDASIEDQARLCRARIEHEGWVLTKTYSDRAQSGSSTLRADYQRMLHDARSGAFDVVVAEALDRLSRDQEDVAGLGYDHGLDVKGYEREQQKVAKWLRVKGYLG